MKKTYKVDVDCANCAAKMEEAVKNTTGVKDAALSFMTLKLKVEFEEGADVDAVMQEAKKSFIPVYYIPRTSYRRIDY